MQGAVRIQAGNGIRRDRALGDALNGDFHAILPHLDLALVQEGFQLAVLQFTQAHWDFQLQIGIVLPELAVSHEVIAGNEHAGLYPGNGNALGLLVFGDVGREGSEQFGFIAAGGLGILGNNCVHLIRRQRSNIHALGLQVFRHHGRDAVRRQCRRGRAARDFLIGQHEGRDRLGRQRRGIDAFAFQVFHDVRGNLTRLERGYVCAGRELLVPGYHGRDVFRRERGNIRPGGRLGVCVHICQNTRGRQLRGGRALRHLGIGVNEGVHMGLLGGGVFRHGVTVDDGVCRDRAGIRGEFIPTLLRAGHIQIGGNGQHFLRQRLVEHAVEAGQIGFDQIEVCGDARELIQRPGYVDVRKHVLDFAFRKALVHEGLNLRQEGQVFREGSLVHFLGKILHFREDRGLIGFGGEAVFAQQREQVAHIVLGLLNAFLIPYRRYHIGERFRVFQSGCAAVGIVPGVEFIQRDLPVPGVFD